ncbi:hypothetical protein AB0E56_11500 [Microbacterium sp. NPDC028030]|uniref:hypothetical protein n=1 Tax=Microbacterium sp. NPDC028030 TaxID=3155124 RepID=UPI0033F318CB
MSEIAQVMSAIAAVVAVAAALWTAWESRRLRAVEVARDDRTREEVARWQASRVSAWAIECRAHTFDSGEQDSGFTVRNASDTPLFDVRVWSADRTGTPLPVATVTVLPPGQYVLLRHTRYHWTIPKPIEEIHGPVSPITRRDRWAVTRMEFTDGHGRRWRREGAELHSLTTTHATSDS